MRDRIIYLFCEMDEGKMYHGSNKSFNLPSTSKIFWVTTSQELANNYAKEGSSFRGGEPIVYTYDVEVKSPAQVNSEYISIFQLMQAWASNRPNKALDQNTIVDMMKGIIKHWHKIGLDNSETATYNHWNMSGEEGNQLLIKFLKALGYDSIHFVEQGYDTYGLFEPSMIKHALS